MPPCQTGDYALPASDWHWDYFDNVFALQGDRHSLLLTGLARPGGRYGKPAAYCCAANARHWASRESLAPRPGWTRMRYRNVNFWPAASVYGWLHSMAGLK